MAWGKVELVMQQIVLICANGSEYNIAVAFTAIENFRSRLAFLDTLFGLYNKQNESLLSRWPALSARVTAGSALRNKLAHQRPIKFPENDSGSRVGLVPFGWPIDRTPGGAMEPITIRHIAHYAAIFDSLHASLLNVRFELEGKKRRLPESDVQQQSLPTVRQIEARMRAAFGRQQRPSGALPGQEKK